MGDDLQFFLKDLYFEIRLPIDTATGEAVCAEASLKGKKKDAVIQCALNACRMLDAQEMLRHHTRGRAIAAVDHLPYLPCIIVVWLIGFPVNKTRDRNWGKNDYYDSDEDTFLDRTGESVCVM